ncbi:MAG TPA: hypothetical protein VHQ45_09745, partial [Gemmatimonadaceae bacterium]|nr:hypothetical protein [Gemmatimonadaceae bacterium]
SSLYTWAALHPERAALALAGLTFAAAGLRALDHPRRHAAHTETAHGIAGSTTVSALPESAPGGP